MGEYDRNPRGQLCTIIANGNTGSKQLKGFVDNRCTTQKVTNQIKVIQKATIDEWCKGVHEAQNPKITLYSHILGDGLGDAGQLGYLVDKVRDLGYNPIPYATYNEYNNKKELVDSGQIAILARTNNLQPVLNKQDRISGWVNECGESECFEIQYPVPAKNTKLKDDKVLRVSEMNSITYQIRIGKLGEKKHHTGIGTAQAPGVSLGYGIPQYANSAYDEEQLRKNLKDCNIILQVDDDLSFLKDAWLVKVNKGQSVDEIFTKAQECSFLILLGGLDEEQQADFNKGTGVPVRHIPLLDQSVLSCLMSKIGCDGGKGMIFAGGEGMYVQALGASKAAVGDVIRGSNYYYQTRQIKADSKELRTGLNFSTDENLGMMDIPQKDLKAHSDLIRYRINPANGSSYNWFDNLNGIATKDKAIELYRWFISSPIPENFLYFGEIINRNELGEDYIKYFIRADSGDIAAKKAVQHIVTEFIEIKRRFDANELKEAYYDECD